MKQIGEVADLDTQKHLKPSNQRTFWPILAPHPFLPEATDWFLSVTGWCDRWYWRKLVKTKRPWRSGPSESDGLVFGPLGWSCFCPNAPFTASHSEAPCLQPVSMRQHGQLT